MRKISKIFNPNFVLDMLNMKDNKQFFHQLNHLTILFDIKNYNKTKELQQDTNLNKKNYAKTKRNKDHKTKKTQTLS